MIKLAKREDVMQALDNFINEIKRLAEDKVAWSDSKIIAVKRLLKKVIQIICWYGCEWF